MFAKTALIRCLIFNLNVLANSVKSENKASLTDDNVASEDFFKSLLNSIFSYELKNLNLEKYNYPAVDLGDEKEGLCIQVTSDNTGEKIEDAITKCNKHSLKNKYKKLVVLIIGEKKGYTREFSKCDLAFNPKTDIWDINYLIKAIQGLETDKLKKMVDFFDKELISKISINATPVELVEEDLKELIDIIYNNIKDSLTTDVVSRKYEIIKRNEDFILKKNEVNKITETFFNVDIRHSLIHQSQIETFLKNPINESSQEKYFKISDAIQKTYSTNTEEYSSIESVFQDLFQKININYENRNLEKRKILVILHNMYFNCDIGINPKN